MHICPLMGDWNSDTHLDTHLDSEWESGCRNVWKSASPALLKKKKPSVLGVVHLGDGEGDRDGTIGYLP